jgi:hypothetical protein
MQRTSSPAIYPLRYQIRTQHTIPWTRQSIVYKLDPETRKMIYQIPIATGEIHEMLSDMGEPNRTPEEISSIARYATSTERNPSVWNDLEREVQWIKGSCE